MPNSSAPTEVLVVDDEALIRWWLVETLTDRGYAVREAEDGQSALRTLTSNGRRPDVVLLDYRLPDSEDLGLLSKIVALTPQGRVILMTAHTAPDTTAGALARGAHGVLHKPFEISEFLRLADGDSSLRV